MLNKKYRQERASVLNTTAKKTAALVIAATKPELKKVELSAYACSDCGFHFSSNAGGEPFCPNCSSGTVTASTKTVASIPATDKDMTSIHCSACGTHNLIESATDRVFAGLAHCVTCGTSLVYEVNDGTNDPADTRPPMREGETVVEHASDADLNSGDQIPGSEPNQRAPEMESDVQVDHATQHVASTGADNSGDQIPGSEPNQRAPEMESEVKVVVADGEQVNDGNAVPGSEPNQRPADMPEASPRQSRWEQAGDEFGDDFGGDLVEPLDGEQSQGQQQGEQTVAGEQQQQQQQASEQDQQQQGQQQQEQAEAQGQQGQQQQEQQQQQAEFPNQPVEDLDIDDEFEQDACDLPMGGPALAMSLASVVLARVKRPELSLVSHDGGIIAQVNGVQIATLTPEAAGDNAKVMHSRAFHQAVTHTAKVHGVRKALAHFGFAETKVEFPQPQAVAALVKTRVAEKASAYEEQASELTENMAHSLQLAAAGLAKGSFKGQANPLMQTLAATLEMHGVQNAKKVVQAAFLRAGDAYNTALLEQAQHLLGKGHKYRNELAEMIGETNAPDFGETEDGEDEETLESRLETAGLKPAGIVKPSETASVHADPENINVFEIRKQVGGRLF